MNPETGFTKDIRSYYLSLAQVHTVKLKLVPNENTYRHHPQINSSAIIPFIQENVPENSCPHYAKYSFLSLQLHIHESLAVLSPYFEGSTSFFLSLERKKTGH